MIIKKLDILSVGKITGIIAAAFGLIAGLLLHISVPLVLDATIDDPGPWWRLTNPGRL